MQARRTGRIRRTWLLVCAALMTLTAIAVGQAPPGGGQADAASVYRALPTPRRILETRPGLSTVDGQYEGLGVRPKRSTLRLQVAGRAGVPNDAVAVVLNLTATGRRLPGSG